MKTPSSVRWITQLPYTICLDILFLLSTKDLIRSQRVSRETRTLIKSDDVLIRFLKKTYPKTREARIARDMPYMAVRQTDWLKVLVTVSLRQKAKFEEIDETDVTCGGPLFRLVGKPSQLQVFQNFHHSTFREGPWDPASDVEQRPDEIMWTYSAEDSLLVYPTDEMGQLVLIAEDLETEHIAIVPFAFSGRILRRMRLRHGVLILEWCHRVGSWVKGTTKLASPHFVTAYRVTTSSDSGRLPLKGARKHSPWVFTPCGEWRLSETLLMLEHTVHSAHNSTHYVSYIWKISPCFRESRHACYGPRSEKDNCSHEEMSIRHFASQSGAHIVDQEGFGARLVQSWSQHQLLRFWDQVDADLALVAGIGLDDLTWDEQTQSVRGHVFVQHQYTWESEPGEWLHMVSTTGIPLTGTGPIWKHECHNLCDFECDDYDWKARDDDISRAPCWLHHREEGEVILSTVFDPDAEVAIAAVRRQRQSDDDADWDIKSWILWVWEDDDGQSLSHYIENNWLDVLRKGRIEGDNRRLIGQSFDESGPRILEVI